MDTKPKTTTNEEKYLAQGYHLGTLEESKKNQAFFSPKKTPVLSHNICSASFLSGVPKPRDLPGRAGSLTPPWHSTHSAGHSLWCPQQPLGLPSMLRRGRGQGSPGGTAGLSTAAVHTGLGKAADGWAHMHRAFVSPTAPSRYQ